ncbi:MAG: multidrug effflux MFS transporter [Gammaproteobacteria bacterium]
MISLVALSIDAMLPALPDIGADLGVSDPNRNQLVVSALFVGLALGQMFYGPMSDSTGRKPAVYAGLALFVAGCLLSVFASSFEMMLAGRALQGFGAAGPRIVCVALVRDQYAGRPMARIMSFVMAVFILVPALAPAFGQGVLAVAGWRAIFVSLLAIALVSLIWFALSQPETLLAERRGAFSMARIAAGVRETCANREAFGYTVAAGFVFGAFVGYLNSAQQILQQQYALGVQFPLYFGVLALAIGGASVANARLVMRFGMRALSTRALIAVSGLSAGYLVVVWVSAGHPPLWSFMSYLMLVFFGVGMLFGNLNALAMEPLGHIAGVGAAVVGSLSTAMSLPLGVLIGQAYDGTVGPLVLGFALLALAALGAMRWAGAGRG